MPGTTDTDTDLSLLSPDLTHLSAVQRKLDMRTFLILFLVIITTLTVTLIAICSQVTLPGHSRQVSTIRPLPLSDTVAQLPNGNLVQFVGAKFMAPAAVDIISEYTEEETQ